MDPPLNALTNALKIDNLTRIPYSIYTESKPSEDQLVAAVATFDKGWDVLRDAERTLRAEGIPALSHLETGSLWVFHLSGIIGRTADAGEPITEHPTSGELPSTQPIQKDEQWLQLGIRLEEEWNLIESSCDVFLSSSLKPPRSTGSADPRSATLDQGPSVAGAVTIDLTLDEEELEDAHEELTPYQKFISAVLAVFTFYLALREGFTPLNSRTLVSPSSLPATLDFKSEDERKGKEEMLPSVPVTIPEIVAPLVLELDAYMSSAGTLVITPHSEQQPAIRRLATSDLTPICLENRDVFLAPWGEWGRLCTPFEDLDPAVRLKSEESWKSNVLSYLRDYGVVSTAPLESYEKTVLQETIENGKWVYVEIWLRSPKNRSMGDLHRILWPESLLFLKSAEGDKVVSLPMADSADADFWKLVFDDPEYSRLASGKVAMLMATLDVKDRPGTMNERDLGAEWWEVESPIKWAETWYKSRHEREKIINAKAEEDKKRELEARHAASLAIEKGKANAIETRREPGPGGVYPTPPDVAIAALSGASLPGATSNVGDSSTFAVGGNDMDLDWNGEQGADSGDAMAGTMGGEADLFGEGMDEIEFMGVTDEDFAFFDKPDLEFGGGDDVGGVGDIDMDVGGVSIQMQDIDGMDMTTENVDLNMSTPPLAPQIDLQDTRLENTQQTPALDIPDSAPALISQHESQDANPTMDNQVRTPPLSPHRAIKLLVPGYSPPSTNGFNFTPPMTTNMKTPSTAATTVTAFPNGPVATIKRRLSLYSPIAFTENVELQDRKYGPGGRFFLPEKERNNQITQLDPTKPEKSHTLKRKRGGAPTSALQTQSQMDDVAIDDEEDSGSEYSYAQTESSDADDSSDAMSDAVADGYYTSPIPGRPQFMLVGQNPRRGRDGGVDVTIPDGFASHRDVEIGIDGEVEIVRELAPPPWERMQPDPLDETLIGVFEDTMLISEPSTIGTLGESEFASVAGLVAEQMAGWMNSTWNGKNETVAEDDDDEETFLIKRRSQRDQALVEEAVKAVFREGGFVRCDLETYAAITDEPPPSPPPPPLSASRGIKPNTSQSRRKENHRSWEVFPIAPPHVRLQRGDNTLEMLPPALHFWETFSLAPISGAKNVISFCFHPAAGALEEGAEFLLERVSSSYEAGRFGVHVRANLGEVVKGGLVPVELPPDSPRSYEIGMRALIMQMESFGSAIAHGIADEGQNVVVYVINPFQHPSAVVDICTAFVRMRKGYEGSIATIPGAKPNNLVLQVVPADFVASKMGLVMRVNVAHRLAVEVYTRCVQTDTSGNVPLDPSAPPVQLSRPLPKKIAFETKPDPSPALLKENQLLHLSYSQSPDERWLTASWSDDTGSLQKTTVINIGRKGTNFLRPFSDILSELWSITTTLIRHPAVKWRLSIARVGAAMPEDEIDSWRAFCASHNRVPTVYLCSIDLQPALSVQESLPELKMDTFFPTNVFIGTPGQFAGNTPTPGGTMMSPDASASTPNDGSGIGELDPDAELIDAADESWGVVTAQHGKVLLLRRAKVVLAAAFIDELERDTVKEILKAWRGLGVIGGFQGGKEGVPWGFGWVENAVKEVSRVL